MNFLDLIIVGAVLVFAGLGAYSGLLRQLSTPVALLGAWLFSWVLEKPLATRLESWFASSQVAELASAVHPHPTVSEALMEAAQVCRGRCVNAPRPRKP